MTKFDGPEFLRGRHGKRRRAGGLVVLEVGGGGNPIDRGAALALASPHTASIIGQARASVLLCSTQIEAAAQSRRKIHAPSARQARKADAGRAPECRSRHPTSAIERVGIMCAPNPSCDHHPRAAEIITAKAHRDRVAVRGHAEQHPQWQVSRRSEAAASQP